MADIPVISIEIDDAQYRAFEERVRQFRASEDATPGPWSDVAVQVAAIQKKFEEMAASLSEQADATEKTRDGIGIWGKGAEAAAASWGFVHLSARRFTTTLAGATRDLVRWERAAVTISALLGAGSLFGIDTLARSASNRRRQASGLGVSTGELAAFQVSYGRLGDTDGLAQGFNRASTDVLARQPLQSLGVDARGKNFAQLFAEALPHVKDLVDRTDPRLLGPTLGAYHLDELGFSETVLRTIRSMSRAEIGDMQRGARDSRALFDIPDDTGRRFQDLVTQLEIAGGRVQTALAGDLVNITPGVTHVSESLVRVIDAMLDRPEVGTWLKRAGDGIEGLANSIGSRDAQDALNKAVDRFKMSREDFDKLERWFERYGGALVDLFRTPKTLDPIVGPVEVGGGRRAFDRRFLPHDGGGAGSARGGAGNTDRVGPDTGITPGVPYDVTPATPNAPGSITPENHPVRYEGNLKIDDRTFHFASGGNHGAFSSPPGDQEITSFTPPGADPRTPFNAGYFRIAPKYDPELGRTRNGVLIHESSHGENVHDVVSSGCFAIPRSEWPQLEETLRVKLAKLGGRAILRVGSDGNAEVVPVGTPPGAPHKEAEKIRANFSPVPPAGPQALANTDHRGRAAFAARTMMAAHPNSRPPPPPAVHVTNDADAQVTVHH